MDNHWLTDTYLKTQIKGILGFYHQHSVCSEGGFYQQLNAQGECEYNGIHHLVSSTRIVVNFSRGHLLFQRPEYLANVYHGLDFIRQKHHWKNGQGYHWLLCNDVAQDSDQYCYGYAFLVLAYANALQVGVTEAKEWLIDTINLMDKYFWQEEYGLFADQLSANLTTLDNYRGQNANMHACEAFIAAYEATQNNAYLERALLLAKNIVQRSTQTTDGLLWEHYHQDWQVDWQYNQNDPQNLYKPWGYQPGHFVEWTKLLLMLNAHRPTDWLVERAKQLMQVAWQHAWDDVHGGLLYGFSPDYDICDDNKYFWVQAEALAAIAWLHSTTGNPHLLEQFGQLSTYIEGNFLVPDKAIWHRLLKRDNQHTDDWIALPGAKCDYHNLGACYDILRRYGSMLA